MSFEFSIRSATANDASAYTRIETDAYSSDLQEPSEVFQAKLGLFPSGCKMVDVGSTSVAFLLSHPWTYEDPPKLNSKESGLPAFSDVFFIHSLTVMKAYQKRGLGSALAKAAIELGQRHGFSRFTLISVQDSISFWQRFGFESVERLPESVWKVLVSYGNSAKFMIGRFG